MKTLKKALSVILCAVILITAAPLSGFVGMKFPEINFGKFMRTLNSLSDPITPTANAETFDGGTWTVKDGNKLLIECTGAIPDYNFPQAPAPWDGYGAITEVYFYEGTTRIGDCALYDFPNVTKIGSYTLTTVSDGSNNTTTKENYFDSLPSTLTEIGKYAFSHSSIKNLVLPSKIENIESTAFLGCPLETITVDASNNFYSVKDNVLYDKSETELILYPSKSTYTTFTIPTGVKTIGNYAFRDCDSLTEIHIPDSVTSIGDYAFYYCRALTEIHISDSVTSIGNSAFFYCESLTEIHIPDSVTSIGDHAFCYCYSLTKIHIPDSVTSIDDCAFYGCINLSEVNFAPDSQLETIESAAFSACISLQRIQLPATVKSIGDYAFNGCEKLTAVEMLSLSPPESDYTTTFYESAITSIEIPQLSEKPEWNQYSATGLQGIPVVDSTDPNACPLVFVDENNTDKYGFSYNSFDSANHTVTCCGYTGNGGDIAIPRIVAKDNEIYYVTHISDTAFDNHSSTINDTITSITLPNTLVYIPNDALKSCLVLENIYVEKGSLNYTSVDGVLLSADKTKLLYYPINKPGNSYTIDSNIQAISNYAFYKNQNLESIDFASDNTLKTISPYAFQLCKNLKSISLPSSLEKLEASTFEYCTQLKNVTIPENLKTIKAHAFARCDSLNEINIPASVSDIEPRAFLNCKSLERINVSSANPYFSSIDGVLYNKSGTSLHTYPAGKSSTEFIIPASVNTVGKDAFNCCNNLTKISFAPDSALTTIDEKAFFGCDKMLTADLSNCKNIFSVGKMSFACCDKLNEINLCDGAKISSIGDSAFLDSMMLQTIPFEKCSEISSIGKEAFRRTKLSDITFTCNTVPAIPEDAKLFDGSPLEEVYVTDLYTKESWIDYLDSGFGGLPLANKSTTGEIMSTVDSNNRDGLGFKYNNFNTSAKTVNIVEFTGSGDVVVPRYVIKNNNLYFVRSFNQDVFAGNKNITSVSFADKVLSIPESAFSGCTSLKSVSFNSQLENISAYAFSGCSSLTSFSTLGEITNIGNGAFSGCTSLKDFSFRQGLTSIGSDAFSGCTSLNSTLILPASLKTIGARAFSGCALKSVQFEGKLTDLGENAFGNIAGLKTAKFRSDPPANVGSSPFGNPDEFYVAYPDSNYEWKNQVSGFTWKGYPAYTYSLISQLPYEDAYPIIVLTVTPDGTPFEGAKVTLGNQTSTTNEDGIALFAYPGEEEQELKIIPGGETYLESSKKLTISRRSPVTIFSLISQKDLIEITVDDKDTEVMPAVFNVGSYEEVKFNFKALSDNIAKVELVSGDKVVYDSEASKHSLHSDEGAEVEIRLHKNFIPGEEVIAKVTDEDGIETPVPLNITVFDGGVNWGFTVSEKDNSKDKFKFNKDQVKVSENKISLDGSGVDILKNISLDLKLDKILYDVEFEQAQLKDCVKYYIGAQNTEDEGDVIHTLKKKKSKDKMFSLREDAKSGFAIEGDVGGYIKIGRTSDQKDFIKEFCLVLALSFSYDFGVTWNVVFVPIRLEISVTGAIEVTVGGTMDYVTDEQFKVLFKTDVMAALKISLGIGVKGFSAGIYGKGSIRSSLPSLVTTLAGEFGVYLKALWIHYNYAIFEGEVTFGNKQKTVAERMLTGPELYDTALYKPLEMLEPSLWNSAAVDEGENVSLQSELSNLSRPQIVSTDDTVMMVFERLNTGLELQNSQELVFSVFDKKTGTWSIPQSVEPGDNKFDNNFRLYSDSEDIYVAFTQANASVDSNVNTAEEGALYQDVYVVKYNKTEGSFDTPERLTENSSYDVTAELAVIDGVPTAVWVRNENGEPLTLDNSNSIYMSRFVDGKWSDEIQLATGLNAITGLKIGTIDGKQYVAAASDSDNLVETPDDSKLYLIDTDKNVITKEIPGFGGNCEFKNIDGKEILLTFCNGKAVAISSVEDEGTVFAEVPEMSSTADAKFLEYEEGMYAISYLSLNETGGCVRAVTYDGTEWHDAITLSESEDYVGAYALDYRDGQFIVVMREDDLVFTSDTEFDIDSTLGGIAFTPSEDMYVNDAIIDSAGIIPGEEFNASVCIVNNAPVHSQYANVILRDADGNIISSSSVEVNLDPGESDYFDVTLTAPSALTTEGCTLTAEPLQKMRAMRFSAAPENKTKQPRTFDISLVSPDLCVEAEQVMLGASQNVLVNVTNDGNEKATGSMLMVRQGDAFSSEEAFTQLEIGEMNPGETKSFLIEIPGEIYTEGEGIVTAYVESDKDLYSFNNKCTVAIMQMSEGEAIYSPDENTSPVLGTAYIETDLYKSSDKKVDITLNGTSFKSIDGLTSGTHYSFSGSTLTLKKAYLSSLTPGRHDITLKFKGKYTDFTETLSIYVTDSSPADIGGRIIISGEAVSGKTLTADTTYLTPTDAEYDITWYSGSTAVSTERTYKVKDSDIGKTIYVKLTAKGDFTGTLTSNSVTVEKTSSTTEFAPVEAAKTCNSITLVKTDGYEYRLSTGDWTTSTVFNNLTADTEYTFYSRKAENDYAYAGNQSVATVIKTAAHTPGDAPTCTKPQTCTVCKAEINPGTGHPDTRSEPAIAPTCMSVGYTAGIYCNDCEAYIEGHEEIAIDENAHLWINGTITTAATCKVNGIKTFTCQHNPDHKKTEDLGINSTNHVNTRNTEAVTPTCVSVGYTEGIYCDNCEKYISGHTEVGINPDNHINTKFTEAVAPTCTSVGFTSGVYCNDCKKYIEGHEEIIDTNAHKWDNGEITTVATCKTEGIRTFTCAYDSNHTYTENLGLNSSNHINTETTEEIAPTCTEVGYTEGVYCKDCEMYLEGHTEIGIDTSAHKWNSGAITTVATCKVEGIKTYTCAYDSNHTYTENLGIDSTNHINTHYAKATAPTCMSIGYTGGTYCDDCEKYISGHEEIINPDAHKWDNGEITTVATCSIKGVKTYTCQHNPDHKKTTELNVDKSKHINTRQTAAVEADCMHGGYTKGVFCDDCEKYISGHTETSVDSSNHKWDNGTITATSQATCVSKGTIIYTCQNNGSHKKYVTYGIDSTNHVSKKDTEATAPTCSSPGYTAGVYCEGCKKYIEGHTEIGIDTSAHKWNNGEITTVATCKAEGIRTYTCEYDSNHTYTEKLGLNPENHINTKRTEAKAPTCTEVGYTEGVYCKDCEMYLEGHTEIGIDTSAHKWNSGEITTVATCKTEGIKTYTCEYDSNHTYTENLGLNTGNHINTKATEAVAPTCASVGYTEGVYCNDCEKFISGHEKIIDTNAHKWDNGTITTVATCKVNGIKTFTCEYDKNHTYTENLGLNSSNHVNTEATEEIAPTCTSIGYTSGTYCNDCQKYISGYEKIPATGHNYKETVTVPDCTNEGYTTHICSVCNHIFTDTRLDALGHDYKSTVTAPNCTNAGFTTNTCARCNDTYTDTKVDALGHKWSEWTEILAPTIIVNGKAERTCSVCKLRETKEIAKLTTALGDTDQNGRITAYDARLALRASVGLESFNEAEISIADIDGNGTVAAQDARLILRASVGLEDLSKYKK